MHIEVLVEDSSGGVLLGHLLPKLLGDTQCTYRVHSYRGVGHIPKGLTGRVDANKRILLDRLFKLLSGYAKTEGIDAVVVVLDVDTRDRESFLTDLNRVAALSNAPGTMFGLAVEEVEAWYLGDREAILAAYPHAKKSVLNRYRQDSICGTWELLADALHPGGAAAAKGGPGPRPGDLKHEWAERIGRHLEVRRNVSPSFKKLCEGVRGLV